MTSESISIGNTDNSNNSNSVQQTVNDLNIMMKESARLNLLENVIIL